jgi:hypothetical protein
MPGRPRDTLSSSPKKSENQDTTCVMFSVIIFNGHRSELVREAEDSCHVRVIHMNNSSLFRCAPFIHITIRMSNNVRVTPSRVGAAASHL